MKDIHLTPQELRILKLIHKRDIEIANILCTGRTNIQVFQNKLKNKFNAETRTEVALKALKWKILEIQDFRI